MSNNRSTTILIVDPDQSSCSAMKVVLHQGGYEVQTATEGAGAIRLARSESPDIALVECDLREDDLSGLNVCKLLAHEVAVPVSVISMNSKPTRELVLKAMRAGASEFLCLPTPPNILHEKLNKVLIGKRQQIRSQNEPQLIDFGSEPISLGQKIDLVTEKATTLRAMPHAVAKVVQLVGTDDSDAADMTKAVQSDSSVATMIMKLANSAYYRRGGPTKQIKDAVVRLGFNECKRVVIGLTVSKLFSREGKNFGFNRLWFWVHSIACAVLAREICTRAAIPQGEEAFTVGLLHDIGKITLDDYLPEQYNHTVQTANLKGIPLYDAELATLGRTHAIVGRKLLDRWRFPKEAGRAIAHHHDHRRFLQDAPCVTSLDGVVYLANQMAKALMLGCAGDFVVQAIPASVWQSYGFSEILDDAFLDRFYEQVEEFCTFLKIS